MRRRYTIERYAERIVKIREFIPNAFIGIDVIVGFPGETDEDFEQTYRFLEEVAPSFIHIFPFSSRKGTPAADMPNNVHDSTTRQRVTPFYQVCTNRQHTSS